MSMLGFVYLVLILGWILIVLFLKCKKTITPHLAFTDNYTDAMRDRRPSVHVIDLPPDENDNEVEFMEGYHHRRHSNSMRSQSQHRLQRLGIDEHVVETYPTDAVVNPAYLHDEDYVINAPPPSYDEVMRQPEVYPKVQQSSKSSEAQI